MGRLLATLRAAAAAAGGAVARAVPDLVGLGGLALVCAGVHELFGRGVTLIVAGSPFVVAYVWREVLAGIVNRRRG